MAGHHNETSSMQRQRPEKRESPWIAVLILEGLQAEDAFIYPTRKFHVIHMMISGVLKTSESSFHKP